MNEQPTPRVIEPEHEVTIDELPRGPKAVANALSDGWRSTWLHVVSEELEGPRRGGEAYGVRFAHDDGRWGWATWVRGKFAGATMYRPVDVEDPSTYLVADLGGARFRLIPLPSNLNATELKAELSC